MHGRFTPYLYVAVGGALGAVARFALTGVIARRLGSGWPWGTFLVNISGCLAIGLVLAVADARAGLHPGWRYFIPIGFIGAYTTFSAFEYETERLLEHGAFVSAAAYVLASNLVGLCAVLAGAWMGRRL
jgi:CrcB protein